MAYITKKTLLLSVAICLFSCVASRDNKRLLVNDNDVRFREIERQLQNLTQTVNKLQQQVHDTEQHIAFYATLSSHTTLGERQTVEFDKVITNIGGGYNDISGVFTVPVTGLYHFATTMLHMQSPRNEIHTQIMKNKEEIGRNYGNGSGTMNVIVMVQKGDSVFVRHHQDLGSTTQIIHGSGYSSFSGFLIG